MVWQEPEGVFSRIGRRVTSLRATREGWFVMKTARLPRILGAAALIVGLAAAPSSAIVMAGAGAAGATQPGGSAYDCTGGNMEGT
jgi:hypothetical protein